jgi:RHS repeat-associated protein
VVTDSSGNALEQLGHYPFGESWYNASNDKLLFTSYERDSESGNDYAMARYNVNRLGRFSSPDPLSGSRVNPQSLNKYAYAKNDPVNLSDPTGMWPKPLYVCSGGNDAYAQNGCIPWGYYQGAGGAGNLIMGNDIFDAIAGAPGTYLSVDMYGNLTFGFSLSLYSLTLNEIDAIRQGVEDPNSTDPPHQITDAGEYPWDGFQVYTKDWGTYTDASGVIPDYVQSLATLASVAGPAQPYFAACQLGYCPIPLSLESALEAAVDQFAAIQEQLLELVLKGAP